MTIKNNEIKLNYDQWYRSLSDENKLQPLKFSDFRKYLENHYLQTNEYVGNINTAISIFRNSYDARFIKLKNDLYIDFFNQWLLAEKYLNRVYVSLGHEALNETRISDTPPKRKSKYVISNFKFDFEDHIKVIPDINKSNARAFTWLSALSVVVDKPYAHQLWSDSKDKLEKFDLYKIIERDQRYLKEVYGDAKYRKLTKLIRGE